MDGNINYYAIIPANVRYDKNLTANAKLLYGEITALCNEKGHCWAGNAYFAELYDVDKTTISRWISQLTELGYVQVTMKYKEGSKEVESRQIRLSVASDTPHRKNAVAPHRKNKVGPTVKMRWPHRKIVKVNNTTNNTMNNTKTIADVGESSSPTSSAKKESKLFSTTKKGKSKVDKWFDHKLDILDEYEFSEEVYSAIYEFLEFLSQMNALLPDISIQSQMQKLIENVPNDRDKCNIINSTVIRGWKSLDYMINEFTKQKTASFDTAKNSQNQFYTEQQKKEMREKYKNASKDDLF